MTSPIASAALSGVPIRAQVREEWMFRRNFLGYRRIETIIGGILDYSALFVVDLLTAPRFRFRMFPVKSLACAVLMPFDHLPVLTTFCMSGIHLPLVCLDASARRNCPNFNMTPPQKWAPQGEADGYRHFDETIEHR